MLPNSLLQVFTFHVFRFLKVTAHVTLIRLLPSACKNKENKPSILYFPTSSPTCSLLSYGSYLVEPIKVSCLAAFLSCLVFILPHISPLVFSLLYFPVLRSSSSLFRISPFDHIFTLCVYIVSGLPVFPLVPACALPGTLNPSRFFSYNLYSQAIIIPIVYTPPLYA